VVEFRPENAVEFGEREFACAMAGRDPLELPRVPQAGNHAADLGILEVHEVKAAEYRVDSRIDTGLLQQRRPFDSEPARSASGQTPVDPRNATREFHAMRREAGLDTTRFHDLRHTAATLLLAMGVDPRTIMATLGHSQISLTMNTYTHVLPALQADAAAKMNAILES
jgi:integrase